MTIKGIAWDHRRCWGPLEASKDLYQKQSGEEIEWSRRSLFSFGEGDLAEFIDDYDLIIYDHPFVGEVCRRGLMLDLNQFLTEQDKAMFADEQIGSSWLSYAYEGGIWGLPIDAAAQMSAWREDLITQNGFDMPKTFSDVVKLAEAARGKDLWVGWPSKPTDLFCSLLSMAASLNISIGSTNDSFFDASDAKLLIEHLKALSAVVHPKSNRSNPIEILDHMSNNDDIIYLPYCFNYLNYSMLNTRRIQFGSCPKMSIEMPARGLLGGAGIGISAKSKNSKAAFDYAMFLCSREFQSNDYVEFGGQSGMRSAWTSPKCDQLTNGFFTSCMGAMERSYLRPTLPGFVGLFHEATLKLAQVIHEGHSETAFIDWMNANYNKLSN